jgi:hypothetical protein
LMVETSGKLSRLVQLLQHWQKEEKRVLVISQFSRLQSLLQPVLIATTPCYLLRHEAEWRPVSHSQARSFCLVGTVGEALATDALRSVDLVIFYDSELVPSDASKAFLEHALSSTISVQRLVASPGLEEAVLRFDAQPTSFELLLREGSAEILGLSSVQGAFESDQSPAQFWSRMIESSEFELQYTLLLVRFFSSS